MAWSDVQGCMNVVLPSSGQGFKAAGNCTTHTFSHSSIHGWMDKLGAYDSRSYADNEEIVVTELIILTLKYDLYDRHIHLVAVEADLSLVTPYYVRFSSSWNDGGLG